MTDRELEIRIRRQESFLLAQDSQFLGMLSSNRYQYDSVMNEYGIYGSKYSTTSITAVPFRNLPVPIGSAYS